MVVLKLLIQQLFAALIIFCAGTAVAGAQEPNIRGVEDAPVTILVFSAFTCPYCVEARKTLEQVQTEYPGKVNVVFKHFPLGVDQQAYLPHEAALAAGEQGKFWEMHDALFAHQADLKDRSKIENLARELKLNMLRFNEYLNKHAGMSQINADKTEANALKVKVTPTFYIDGYKFDGMQQAQVFEMMIQHMMAAGTGADKKAFEAAVRATGPRSTYLDGLLKNTGPNLVSPP